MLTIYNFQQNLVVRNTHTNMSIVTAIQYHSVAAERQWEKWERGEAREESAEGRKMGGKWECTKK